MSHRQNPETLGMILGKRVKVTQDLITETRQMRAAWIRKSRPELSEDEVQRRACAVRER